ncbi:uncharacterized protein PRCAT00002686001 [Priceomyces carsonii]|uniref:uncharacterized protein n=1 Tax=Priceomyces carsonii TaxID=28549 RepID=UPI002ED96DA4|nr:unnamed protein product [Priceomyces carsonii]
MISMASDLTISSNLISWSSNGFIAYALPNTHNKANLYLTYLENLNGRTWQIAKEQEIAVKLDKHITPELSLVSWSNLSTDLAVSDKSGNLFILLAGVGFLKNDNHENGSSNGTPSLGVAPTYELTSYNRMEIIYRHIIDPSPPGNLRSLNLIVEIKWLGIAKLQIVNNPATVTNMEKNVLQAMSPFAYTYSVSQHQPQIATHPISTKQACLALRQNGVLNLYYQGEHRVDYYSIETKLSDEPLFITHASIGFADKQRIIITAFDKLRHKISTYLVEIDWKYLVESAKRQRSDPHYHTPKESQSLPTMSVKKIHEMEPMATYIDSCKKEDDDKMEVDTSYENERDNNLVSEIGRLASIDLASVYYEEGSQLNVLISYISEFEAGKASTTIYRYELHDSSDLVPDAFTEIGSRKGVSHPNKSYINDYTLVLIDKLMRPGKIQSIETALNDSIFSFIFEKGRVDAVERKSMKLVSEKEDTKPTNPPSTISNIFDSGFNFPPIDEGGNMLFAVSPNFTSVVYLSLDNEERQLNFRVAEKAIYLEILPKDLFLTAVGFAFRHAYACYTNSCSDDLIVMIQVEIQRVLKLLNKNAPEKTKLFVKKFIESIICESHKAINFHLDAFGKESVDKLLSNPPLQKLLSLQLVLGEFLEQKIISDISWIVLNLRSTSFGIMFLLSNIYRQISKKKPSEDTLQDSVAKGECIMSLIGNIKWLIDLMIYLNQELLQLAYTKDSPASSKVTLTNSVALPLILAKVPRLFLMYGLSSIGKTNEILKKLHKELSESAEFFSPMREALNRYFTIYNHSPLTLSLFESFLRESDVYITSELNKIAGSEKAQILKIEQKLACQGEIPEQLIPLANKLIENHNTSINRDFKLSELYFCDVDWINVGMPSSVGSSPLFPEDDIIISGSNETSSFSPRVKFSKTEWIDGLRKIIIPLEKDNNSALRKCTRCRSVSLVSDPLIFNYRGTRGLWTMVFQRTCICGNAWVNCQVE